MSKHNEVIIYKEERSLEHQVDDKATELSKQIAKVDTKSELDALYDAFKINDTKKNVFRINKLNNLLDKITEEATARFEQRPGEMSNKEVIDYMNAVSNQIDRSKDTLSQIKDVNLTQVNNTVNVNIDNKETSLSRESREKVIDFIKDILKNSQEETTISKDTDDVIDADIVAEGEKKDNEN